jgi:hypothetical protein
MRPVFLKLISKGGEMETKNKACRGGIAPLTAGQCSRIAGGDPGMSLAVGGGDGGGGGMVGAMGSAMAGMGIGIEGGPMAVVTIGLPGDAPLGGFDKFLMSTAGAAAGYATAGFIAGIAEGAALGTALGPAGWIAGAAIGGLAYFAAEAVIQHTANSGAYTDGHGVRHAAP